MTDFDDDFDDEGARDGLTRRLRTEGAMIAYRTAIAICLDPKAPANAKASAVNSLFRAGGFFANQDGDDGPKDPSQMTAGEIDAVLRRAQTELNRQQDRDAKPPGNLFD